MDDREFAQLISKIQNNDPTLTTLYLQNSHLSMMQIFTLAEQLKNNHVIESIDLSRCMLIDDEFSLIVTSLSNMTQLKHLNLSHNGLDDTSLSRLNNAINSNFQLHSLDLSYNSISCLGIEIVSKMIKKLEHLTTLKLVQEQCDHHASNFVVKELFRKKMIQHIEIQWGAMTLTDSLTLLSLIKTCPLVHLKVSWQENNNFDYFLDMLLAKSQLKVLCLSITHFNTSDLIKLVQCLCQYTHLESLDLSNNYIGNAGGAWIAQLLKKNPTLKTVNLSNTRLENYGLSFLSNELEKVHSEHHVILEKNNIRGDDGALMLENVAYFSNRNAKLTKIIADVDHHMKLFLQLKERLPEQQALDEMLPIVQKLVYGLRILKLFQHPNFPTHSTQLIVTLLKLPKEHATESYFHLLLALKPFTDSISEVCDRVKRKFSEINEYQSNLLFSNNSAKRLKLKPPQSDAIEQTPMEICDESVVYRIRL